MKVQEEHRHSFDLLQYLTPNEPSIDANKSKILNKSVEFINYYTTGTGTRPSTDLKKNFSIEFTPFAKNRPSGQTN